MQLYDIVTTSQSVRETSARSDKIRHLASCLRRIEPDGIETAVVLFSGEPRQVRIGVGPADEMLASQTAELRKLAIANDPYTVYV
jgi:hypothetical protein